MVLSLNFHRSRFRALFLPVSSEEKDVCVCVCVCVCVKVLVYYLGSGDTPGIHPPYRPNFL